MLSSSLGRLDEHVFFILFTGFMLVMFWFAAWELIHELVEHLHKRHGFAKWKICILILLFVILMIGFFPQILHKI